MAQSHPALRAIRRLPGKCQRGSHSGCHVPLTPALSLRERENPPLAFSTTWRGVWPNEPPEQPNLPPAVPSPPWEGQGEGNRLAVRPSNLDPSRHCRTSRVLRAEPEVSYDNEFCCRVWHTSVGPVSHQAPH